tara:strand:- start:806 stop:1267 length:462 start_codon:yes stop_codon:yes gene_type:complete
MKLTKEQSTGNESIDNLLILTCRLAKVSVSDLLGSTRTAKVAEARVCVGKVLRECFDLTQVEVGEILNRDHATVHFYEKEHSTRVKFRYYSSMYNELKMFARDEGYEIDSSSVVRNSEVDKLRIEISTLRSQNKRLRNELKLVESFKKSLLSL